MRLKIMFWVVVVLTVSWVSVVSAQEVFSCPSFNTYASDPQVTSDAQEHTSGNHQGSGTFNENCLYSAQAGTNSCAVTCTTTTTGDAFENGTVEAPYWHGTGFDPIQSNANSNGPQVQCGGQVAVAVRSCLVLVNCDISVSVNGSVFGIGGNVSYSNTPIWKPTLASTMTCKAQNSYVKFIPNPGSDPTSSCLIPFTTAPGDYLESGYEYIWDNASCQWLVSSSW
jgi:hypothetical protein